MLIYQRVHYGNVIWWKLFDIPYEMGYDGFISNDGEYHLEFHLHMWISYGILNMMGFDMENMIGYDGNTMFQNMMGQWTMMGKFIGISWSYQLEMENFIWLVVWNMFYFSIYWKFHNPNWQICFRGVGIPPTSYGFDMFQRVRAQPPTSYGFDMFQRGRAKNHQPVMDLYRIS